MPYRVTIDGVTYRERNLKVRRDGAIVVNGKPVSDPSTHPVALVITGDVGTLTLERCNDCHVEGNVGQLNIDHGDAFIGGNTHTVNAAHSLISCKVITGSASAPGGVIYQQTSGDES